MNSLEQLIETLRKTGNQSKVNKRYAKRHAKLSTDQIDFESLKKKMSKQYRVPWKLNGTAQRKQQFLALKNRQLDNWQISRMSLSKRSYLAPKNYKGMKIPSISRQFSHFDSKDEEGHLPFLYESQVPKLKKIESSINHPNASFAISTQGRYFGMGRLKYSCSDASEYRYTSSNNY